jgi:hypothetical protein
MISNVDLIKSIYQAFQQGDLDRVLELLDPQVAWTEAEGITEGGIFIGREAVLKEVFLKIAAEWDNFQADVDEWIDAGDIVISLGYDSGIYKATGKSMRAATASFWTLKNGKVVKFVQYIDTLKVFQALSANK